MKNALSVIPALLIAAAALAGDGLDPAAMSALGISNAPPAVTPHAGPWTWTNGPFDYDGSGNIVGIGNQTFRYDEVQRLVYAEISRQDQSGTQIQTYGYDIFGNMLQRVTNGSTVAYPTSSATNRLNAPNTVFDEAGNQTRWQASSGQIYDTKFDALNMAQELWAGASRHIYLYTADDERIWSWDTTSEPNVSHWKLRGLDGKVLRDFENTGTTWSLSRDYVYRGGQLLAAVTPSNTLYFSLDHLGTPRVITDGNAVRVGFHHYFPFGEEWTLNQNPQEGEPMKFTGHERDAALAGLDYMHARYYSAEKGRFLSVDPVLTMQRALFNPHTWNRYAYVENDPVNLTDPTGECPICVGESDCIDCREEMAVAVKSILGHLYATREQPLEEVDGPLGLVMGPSKKAGQGIFSTLRATFFRGGTRLAVREGSEIVVRSVIHNDKLLVRAAAAAGKQAQASLDDLVRKLAQGNMNPGISTRWLFGNVLEARARDGARVYFRRTAGGGVEILAKSTKHNQDQVIQRLRELYGG